jgi:hypothetical protein
VIECGAVFFAFALIPNHVHLVLRTGAQPLAELMSRLNTGHARRFHTSSFPIGPMQAPPVMRSAFDALGCRTSIIPGLSNTLVAQLGKLPPRSLNTRQMGASSAGPSTSPGADAPVRNQQVAGSNPAVDSIRFAFGIR